MALTPSEITLIEELKSDHDARWVKDEYHLRYYLMQQRIEQLGMALPPNMRNFLVPVNWPRVVVRTITARQRVRALILPGEEQADPQLRSIWDANNLSSHTKMFRRDKLIYGRGFMSVGTNESNPDLPIVRVESPREVEAKVDTRTETMTAAARFYGTDPVTGMGPTSVTLYQPDVTIWITKGSDNRWTEVDRDVHGLGVVPIVMGLNERMSGGFAGESELTDIIPLTDSVCRSLTNLQFAQEAHGVPSIWATGVAKGDFVDENGQPVPMFEAYFDAIKMLSNKDAKWGQFSASDLKNFETAIEIYGKQASVTTGFPGRYFGLQTVNPAGEGAIGAEEVELVNRVEDKNESEGMELGWTGGLAYRFSTGEWVEGNRVRADYFDPGTPTIAQRMDALVKFRSVDGISREGMWDELGWSEARKAKEREYLAAESLDPIAARVLRNVSDDADVGA